jgi:hypothetical protein
VGASLGLQANGLPSGAQQVPLTDPCGDEKLHSCPLLKVLHHAEQLPGKSAMCVGDFHQVTPLKSASTCVAVDEL